MFQIIIVIIGYFIGALGQTSYWYGRSKNVDIRRFGSGNAGTTNAMRTLGKRAGLITAIGDVVKVLISALITWLIFRGTGMPTMLIFIYSGLGTVLGHNFPFFMKFKGGKGVATMAGVIISLFFQPVNCWVMTLMGVLTFFGILIITRYASLASLCLAVQFLSEFIIWNASGRTELFGTYKIQGICIVIIITALTFLRHIGNIERLVSGTERRFGDKSSKSPKKEAREEKARKEIYETPDLKDKKENGISEGELYDNLEDTDNVDEEDKYSDKEWIDHPFDPDENLINKRYETTFVWDEDEKRYIKRVREIISERGLTDRSEDTERY